MVALTSKHRTNRIQRKQNRKGRPIQTLIEQNNYHTQLMHEMQFYSSFNLCHFKVHSVWISP